MELDNPLIRHDPWFWLILIISENSQFSSAEIGDMVGIHLSLIIMNLNAYSAMGVHKHRLQMNLHWPSNTLNEKFYSA